MKILKRVRPGRRGRRGAILPQVVDEGDLSDDSGLPEDFLFQLDMPPRHIELDSGVDEPLYV